MVMNRPFLSFRPTRNSVACTAVAVALGSLTLFGGCSQESPDTAADSTASAETPDGSLSSGDGNPTSAAEDRPATGIDTTDITVSPTTAAGLDEPSNSDKTSGKPASTAPASEATLVEVKSFHEFFKDKKTVKRRWDAKLFSDNSRINHGPFVQFFEDGTSVSEKGNYTDGKRTGEWEFYRSSGKLAKKGSYADDKVDGLWMKYRDDGSLDREESYKDGKKEGLWKMYAPDGKQVVRQIEYKQDKLDGLRQEWYDNGQLKVEIPYVNNQIHGTQKVWYPSGKQQSEMNYERGKRHGTMTSWTESGSVADQKTFKNDVLTATP